MVAGLDYGRKPALDVGDAITEQRSAGYVGVPVDAFEAALGFDGERNRKIALSFAQNIDRKVRASPEVRKKIERVVDADQDQWRLDGYRSK